MDALSMAVPGLAGAALAALALGVTRGREERDGLRAALALALAFVVARLVVRVPESFPPTYGENWLAFLGAITVAVAWPLSRSGAGRVVRLVQVGLLLSVGTYLLLAPLPALDDRWLRIGVYSAAGLALTALLDRLSTTGPRLLLVGGPSLAAGAAGALFAAAYTADTGKTLIGLSLAWLVVTGATFGRAGDRVGPPSAGVFGPLFTFTIAAGVEYGYGVDLRAVALLAVCPVLPWALEWTALRRRPAWVRVVAGALLTAAAATAALVLVLAEADEAASLYG